VCDEKWPADGAISFYLIVQSTARPIARLQSAAIAVLVANNAELVSGERKCGAGILPWATGAATFTSCLQWPFRDSLCGGASEKPSKWRLAQAKNVSLARFDPQKDYLADFRALGLLEVWPGESL
jgi:hypothetical protein